MPSAVIPVLLLLTAGLLIALALVWPQGLGAVSPPPFGHPLAPPPAAAAATPHPPSPRTLNAAPPAP